MKCIIAVTCKLGYNYNMKYINVFFLKSSTFQSNNILHLPFIIQGLHRDTPPHSRQSWRPGLPSATSAERIRCPIAIRPKSNNGSAFSSGKRLRTMCNCSTRERGSCRCP